MGRIWAIGRWTALVLLLLPACLEWKQPTEADRVSVARYVSAILTADGTVRAVVKPGEPGGAGAPTVNATIPDVLLLGGTIQVKVTSAQPFSRIVLSVPGVPDYWELTLPTPTLSQDVLIVISQEVPQPQFTVALGAGLGSGAGAPLTKSVSVLTVGTGEVQVNVTWNSKADIDLYVVDPSSQEIYYGRRRSTTGGELDLDSNAACASDGPRAENVYWRGGLIAPRGEYAVRVNNWANCGEARTDYVVTINVRGQAPRTYTGFFTGAGVGGAEGAGRLVDRVTY